MKPITTYRALLWVTVACILCLVFALKQSERRADVMERQLGVQEQNNITAWRQWNLLRQQNEVLRNQLDQDLRKRMADPHSAWIRHRDSTVTFYN